MRTLSVWGLIIIAGLPAMAYARGGGHSRGHSYGSYSSGTGHVNSSSHYTHDYFRSDGTHVSGYHATDPNGTRNDNYSTRGNVNP